MSAEELALFIFQSLDQGGRVEVDGLGIFRKDDVGTISLRDSNRPRVFIAYAIEDAEKVDALYSDLEARGYSPWMDRKRLLPGQNWPQRIQEAIENADYFIACFSKNSVAKRGGFQAEIRYALDCANRVPLDDVFLIPARLDACRVPTRITKETQYIDLFPDWAAGLELITKTMERNRRRNPA